MKFPEHYRAKHPMGWDHKEGDGYGWFMIPSPKDNKMIAIQASDGDWEHVSASLRNRCPTWEEMCYIKNLFWDEDECVVQYHPPKSDYVNMAKYCLHLWKPNGVELPRPPKNYVGF